METTSSLSQPACSRPFSGWLIGVLAMAAAGLVVLGLFYYVMGWSDRRMAPVRLGMSGEQVKAAVGEPKELKKENGITWWSYGTWWTSDANVFFDGAGRVRAIETD